MSDNARAIPVSMEDVAETFGLGVAVKLMQHYGGQDVEFAKKPKPDLIELLGEEKAIAVSFFLSGQRMYVPHGKAVRRRSEVQKLERADMKRGDIARTLGISARHVRRLSSAPPPELPLFPDIDDEN